MALKYKQNLKQNLRKKNVWKKLLSRQLKEVETGKGNSILLE